MIDWIKKHKNISLFAVLIVAVAITYFFEERASRNEEAVLEKKLTLLDTKELGDILAIQGIKLSFEKRGDDYYDKESNLKLSRARLDEFFTILSGLKIKSFLDQKEVERVGIQNYIPDPSMQMSFKFEKGEITFILGKKLEYDQSFYMQIIRDQKSQVVIANDESPDPGVYQNDEQYKKSDAKYQRLQMVFLLTNKYFHDTKVLKDLGYEQDKINFKEITISTFRNKKYTINFKDSVTNPPVPKGLKYLEENWISFHRVLTNLEAKGLIYPGEEALLKEPLSRFEVTDREDRKYTLDVYQKYGEENGYFLKSSLDKAIYQLKQEEARYFFVNVQDFWEKKITPSANEYDLTVTFFDGKKLTVFISDKDLFKVTSKTPGVGDNKLKSVYFKQLVDYIKIEGDHVSELTEKPSDILKHNILGLSFENKNLNVILEDNDAITIDPSMKVKIHHYIGEKLPFSIKYEDYVSP
jgi:hypothetical protein